MGRAPCCDKANVKRGPWSPEEDAKLKSYIQQHGAAANWIALPQKIGLKRCGKSCRLRWLNYLRPNIRHGGFSEEEDNIICSLYLSIGSRWSVMAAQLPGRTDNDIKNYWNTRLKKKLLGKHRKEQELARKQKQEAAAIFKQTSATATAANPLRMMAVENSTSQQQPYYWPHMPLLAPCFSNYSSNHIIQHHYPSFNHQDSITSSLLKLGGTFSNSESEDHHVYRPSLHTLNNSTVVSVPLMGTDDQLMIPQQIYDQEQFHNGASSSSSACISSNNDNVIIDHHNNQVEMGLVLHGVEEDMMVNIENMIGTVTSTSTSTCTQTTTTNWCDDYSTITTTTSLICPQLPPSNHTRTAPHQHCAFQDHHLTYHGA